MNTAKILIVDDSRTDLTLMATPLRASGYEVITASDGEEAITKTLEERPDCVVLDVVLPKQNGFQVCRRLKQMEESHKIPVILVSVKNTPLDVRWGMQQGADLYLAKPFRADELLASIRSVL